MTTTGRTIIATVLVVGGLALLIVGVLVGGDRGSAAMASGSAFVATVAGYAFGDRNGEKRLAAALTVIDASAKAEGAAPVLDALAQTSGAAGGADLHSA